MVFQLLSACFLKVSFWQNIPCLLFRWWAHGIKGIKDKSDFSALLLNQTSKDLRRFRKRLLDCKYLGWNQRLAIDGVAEGEEVKDQEKMNPRIYSPVFLAQAQHLQNEINKVTRALSFIIKIWFIKIWQSQNTNHLPFFRLADGMNSLSSFFLVTRKSEMVWSANPLLCKNQFDEISLLF